MFSTIQQFQISIAMFCIPWIAHAVCIGHNYEAGTPVPDVVPPTVTLVQHNSWLTSGKTVTLSAHAVVDTQRGGEAQFYWCAQKGHFEVDASASNFEKVRYVVPTEEGSEDIQISVQVSDGLGYVGGDSKFFTVKKPLLVRTDFNASFFDAETLLTWKILTESEGSNFVVWRGQPKGQTCTQNPGNYGEVVQLNVESNREDSHSTTLHVHEDPSAQRGTTYCYVLEETDPQGNRVIHWDLIQSVNF